MRKSPAHCHPERAQRVEGSALSALGLRNGMAPDQPGLVGKGRIAALGVTLLTPEQSSSPFTTSNLWWAGVEILPLTQSDPAVLPFGSGLFRVTAQW